MGETDESYPPDVTNIVSRVADLGFDFFASGCATPCLYSVVSGGEGNRSR